MKNLTWLFILTCCHLTTSAQDLPPPPMPDYSASPAVLSPDKKEVVATVRQLFDGMRAGDSAAVRAVFHPSATMHTAMYDRVGSPLLRAGSVDRFVGAVGTPHDEVWDEKIWAYHVQLDDNLATVWTPYTFFLGEKLSHCGVNTFTLFRSGAGWKILNIADTRRTEGCQDSPDDGTRAVHCLLDDWHRAAAIADEDVFFGSMTADGIYLGTDATERWERDEMKEWSKKYFERESAWDFTPISRHLYFPTTANWPGSRRTWTRGWAFAVAAAYCKKWPTAGKSGTTTWPSPCRTRSSRASSSW